MSQNEQPEYGDNISDINAGNKRSGLIHSLKVAKQKLSQHVTSLVTIPDGIYGMTLPNKFLAKQFSKNCGKTLY